MFKLSKTVSQIIHLLETSPDSFYVRYDGLLDYGLLKYDDGILPCEVSKIRLVLNLSNGELVEPNVKFNMYNRWCLSRAVRKWKMEVELL